VDFDCIYFVKIIRTMRLLFLSVLTLTSCYTGAQIKLPGANSFRSEFQKVIEDFTHNFSGIRGELMVKNPQTIEYASRVVPYGTEDPVITEYSSGGKEVYTWQATIIKTEDFTEAEKKYKWLFNQLKGMNVKYIVDQYTLRGKYEAPSESLKFATSDLTLANPPDALKKLKIEVSMQFEFPEWKVALLVYEKEKEDNQKAGEMDQ
jgi:hypothetical protein